MTSVVVNDASCLIDLRKGGLLPVLRELPYALVVPLPVRKSEILDFSNRDWRILHDAGMITHDLTPEEIGQAFDVAERHPALSANDCFCLVTALVHSGILLTGDAQLRRAATGHSLDVHGVLWIVDQLDAAACPASLLIDALLAWQRDSTVFLPAPEISWRLTSLKTRHGPANSNVRAIRVGVFE